MNFKNSRHVTDRAVVVIIGIMAVLALALMAFGCGFDKASTGDGMTVRNNFVTPLLTQEGLQEVVGRSLGETAQVRFAILSGDKTSLEINIAVDRPATCEDGFVEATMSSLSRKIVPTLFEYPEVSSVSMTMYGVTQGTKSDEIASKVFVNRVTAQDIDWSMFGPMTMSSMVTEYYIHPKILENSNVTNSGFGGMYN
jgi:hypothetical protein